VIANQDDEKFAHMPVQTQVLVIGLSFFHVILQSSMHKLTNNARRTGKGNVASAANAFASGAKGQSGSTKDGYAELSAEPVGAANVGRDSIAAEPRQKPQSARCETTCCSWKTCLQAVSVVLWPVPAIASGCIIVQNMQTRDVYIAGLIALLMVLLVSRTCDECVQIYDEVSFAGICEADPVDLSSPTRDKIEQHLKRHQPKALAHLDVMIRKYGAEHLWEMVRHTHAHAKPAPEPEPEPEPELELGLELKSEPEPELNPSSVPQEFDELLKEEVEETVTSAVRQTPEQGLQRKGWAKAKAEFGPTSDKVAQSVLEVVAQQRLAKQRTNKAKLIKLQPLIDQLKAKLEPMLQTKSLDWDDALPIVERIGCDSRRDGQKMLEAALTDPDSFGEVVLEERHEVAKVLQHFWAQYSLEKTRKDNENEFSWAIFSARLVNALADYVSFWNMLDLVSMAILWQLMYYVANAGHRLDVMDMLSSTASLLLVIRSCE
jgi:hypothetical protein